MVVVQYVSTKNVEIDAVIVVVTRFVSTIAKEAGVKNVRLRISAHTVNNEVVAYPVKVLEYVSMIKLGLYVGSVVVGQFASTK